MMSVNDDIPQTLSTITPSFVHVINHDNVLFQRTGGSSTGSLVANGRLMTGVESYELLLPIFTNWVVIDNNDLSNIPSTYTTNLIRHVLKDVQNFAVDWNNPNYAIVDKIIMYNPFICHLSRLDSSHKCGNTYLIVNRMVILVENGTIDSLYFINITMCRNYGYPTFTSHNLCCRTRVVQYADKLTPYLCITNRSHMTRYYREQSINCIRCNRQVIPSLSLCYDCANRCEKCGEYAPCVCSGRIRCECCGCEELPEDIIADDDSCKLCHFDIINCFICGTHVSKSNIVFYNTVYFSNGCVFIVEDMLITIMKYFPDSVSCVLDSDYSHHELLDYKVQLAGLVTRYAGSEKQFNRYIDVTCARDSLLPDFVAEETSYTCSKMNRDWYIKHHYYTTKLNKTNEEKTIASMLHRCKRSHKGDRSVHAHCVLERFPLTAILVCL